MSATYVAFRVPKGKRVEELLQGKLAIGGLPAIAPFLTIQRRLARIPGFEIEKSSMECREEWIAHGLGRIWQAMEERTKGLPPQRIVTYTERSGSISYAFSGEPVDMIIMTEHSRCKFRRVLKALDDMGPFCVFDPVSGEFLSPDEL